MIPGNPLRILLVDADVGRRERVSRDLERSGYDVDVSDPGRAAITRALQYWPDVIVVHGDRKRFEARLHRNPYLTHIRVIRCHDESAR